MSEEAMLNEHLLLRDDVSDYMFRLGRVETSWDIYGVQNVGIAEIEEFSRARAMLPTNHVEYLGESDRKVNALMLDNVHTMPEPLYRYRTVSVDLQGYEYTEDGEIFTRRTDALSMGLYEYLLSKGIGADTVISFNYDELYEGEELLYRQVMFWLEVPSPYAYSRGDDRVVLDTIYERGLDVTPYRDRFETWYIEQKRWYESLGLNLNSPWIL